MPILSPIGRKHPRMIGLIGFIYLLLLVGGVTMIYPFLLMISGSMKGASDAKELDVVPRFLRQDAGLYQRYVEALFNESPSLYKAVYDRSESSFDQVQPPETISSALVADWMAFRAEVPLSPYARMTGFMTARVSRSVPQKLREFKQWMIKTYENDIHRMNRELGTDFVNWHAFYVPSEYQASRLQSVSTSPFQKAFEEFANEQSMLYQVIFSPNGFYRHNYLITQFTRDIKEYNRAHGSAHSSYDEIRLTRRLPEKATLKEQETWEQFVRYILNLQWVRVDAEAASRYHAYLQAKYRSIEILNRNYGTDYPAFQDIPIIDEPPQGGHALSDWDGFIKGWQDPDSGETFTPDRRHLSVHGPDFLFQDYLHTKYGDIATLNRALDSDYPSFDAVSMPQREAHYLLFQAARQDLKWEFATANYRAVLDYLVFHGRGILNTAIFCSLAVLLALIVNPLAAYALSRYKLPSAYKVLLFLLLTMAFPPIVTQIPVFLTLRDLGLLNTFAALVLPGMANGYAIFLLKGFFDSLPRELYESASMDGANEWTMFWIITMSLSKPILAVIALNAFTGAYASFMFALLICQDEKMWTLMVWLYQLQMRSGQAVMYASLLIAAIPTFLIFFFCQNIIMRGIVVPVEK